MNYIKPQRKEKIIQFGEGGFLRGFVDWILQITNEETDFEGSVVVVQPIEQGMCDLLSAQDCVYTHVMRGLRDGQPVVEKKLIDVISRCVKPYDNYDEYLSLAANPDIRFVVSNTTESGIAYSEGDALVDTPPKSFPAKVTALLYKRFTLGLDGFVFLPCELIDKNGETLKNIVLRYADDWYLGEEFKSWVQTQNILIVILSIVLGAVIGHLCDLDRLVNRLGDWIEAKTKGKFGNVADGFVNASLLFCVGAMMVVGALNSGLSGDHTMQYTKSMLDMTSAVIFASSMGFGVLLSAIPVLILQGGITLLAVWIEPLLTERAIAEMTAVGSLLIIGLSFNMMGITKLKVMNYLPAIFLPILFCMFM